MARKDGQRTPAGRLSYRFDHVLLWVNDEAASFRFYAETLGFPILNDDEKGLYTVGTPGGFAIAFHRKGVDEDGTGMLVDVTGAVNVHIDFHVPDVDRAYSTLRERGVRFLHPPKDMPWGERHTWLYDPDGYIIGLSGPIPRVRKGAGASNDTGGESGAHD